jgi:hypothetical protein
MASRESTSGSAMLLTFSRCPNVVSQDTREGGLLGRLQVGESRMQVARLKPSPKVEGYSDHLLAKLERLLVLPATPLTKWCL